MKNLIEFLNTSNGSFVVAGLNVLAALISDYGTLYLCIAVIFLLDGFDKK